MAVKSPKLDFSPKIPPPARLYTTRFITSSSQVQLLPSISFLPTNYVFFVSADSSRDTKDCKSSLRGTKVNVFLINVQ